MSSLGSPCWTAAITPADHNGLATLIPKLLDAIERHTQEGRQQALFLGAQGPGRVHPHRSRLPHLRSEVPGME
jgi:hypothetical protein